MAQELPCLYMCECELLKRIKELELQLESVEDEHMKEQLKANERGRKIQELEEKITEWADVAKGNAQEIILLEAELVKMTANAEAERLKNQRYKEALDMMRGEIQAVNLQMSGKCNYRVTLDGARRQVEYYEQSGQGE